MQKVGTASLTLFLVSAHSYQLHPLSRNVNWKTNRPGSSSKPNNIPSRSSLSQVTREGDDMSSVDASDMKQSLATKVIYTVGSSTSIIVSITFFLVLAIQRDALMVAFFVGAIANGILSKILKKILNQDRPSDAAIVTPIAAVEQPSDKGMPSSHAMSLGFIGTFTMLTWEWTRLIIPVYAAISLYYRVQTRLHTREQVVVGLIVGSTNGCVWRHLIDGRNPFGLNIMEYLSRAFLNDHGLLPIPLLVVPILAGLVVVGSLERKISKFLQKKES